MKALSEVLPVIGRHSISPVLNLQYLSRLESWRSNGSSRVLLINTHTDASQGSSFLLSYRLSSSHLKQKCIFSEKALTARLAFSRQESCLPPGCEQHGTQGHMVEPVGRLSWLPEFPAFETGPPAPGKGSGQHAPWGETSKPHC